MAAIIEKGKLENFLGYELLEQEIKDSLSVNPKLKKEVENWLEKHVGKGNMVAIKTCDVEFITYSEIDIEDMDEFETKEFIAKVRKNTLSCPNHRTCPLFNSDSLVKNDKCMLELMDSQFLTRGLMEELEVDVTDFNDQVLVGQLIGMNLIYNRAMRGLSAGPLIDEIKSFSKGAVNIETKVNENFAVAERALNMMEKVRKSLILNRDDKMKVKQIKKANTEAEAKKRVEEMIKNKEQEVFGNNWADSIVEAEVIEDLGV